MNILKRGLGYFHVGYRVITGIIIYFGSYFFAVAVSTRLIVSGEIIYPFILAGIVGSVVNYFLYRFYSSRYHYWYLLKKRNNVGSGIFFLPPVSTFFMATALSMYCASLFVSSYKEVWIESKSYLPEIIKNMSGLITEQIIIVGIVGIVAALIFWSLFFVLKTFVKSRSVELFIFGIAIVGVPSLLIGVLMITDGGLPMEKFGAESSAFLEGYVEIVILVVLGFIPFHWIYELFVAPFKDKIQFKKFSGKIQN